MKNSFILIKQKRKFLLYNLISFTIIFALLGLVTTISVDRFFYSNADKELDNTRLELSCNRSSFMDAYAHFITTLKRNPRISGIIYNEDKEIMISVCPENVNFDDLSLPSDTYKIYNKKLDNVHFRVHEFSFEDEGHTYYTQILINVDGEVALRNNIVFIYLICLAAIIVMVTLASYIMSDITLQPIKKAMDEQTRFVSDASHELRTPLTTLHSRLEYLLSQPSQQIIEQSEEISDCLSEVKRLVRLTDSLLSLAKSDADKISFEITEFDLFELINKVSSPYKEIAEFNNKTFNVEGVSIKISADLLKIRQVLVILFDNAMKYTNEGDKITVRVRKVKNKIELTVSDTGIGISESGITKVFDRFFRDDNSRGKIEGSGLGLSIAKQIILEHKGTITAKHNSPKGVVFVIYLMEN